jgi:dihydrofolate synthase/folylpolyglutamate synthase
MQVLNLLEYRLDPEIFNKVLPTLGLAGRFESRIDQKTRASVILDVGHNPAAAADLSSRLSELREGLAKNMRVIAVLAVLDDKDIEGIVLSLLSTVDIWYIAQVEGDRRLAVEEALSRLATACPDTLFKAFPSVKKAYQHACSEAQSIDRVLVAGSFHTVSSIRELSRAP